MFLFRCSFGAHNKKGAPFFFWSSPVSGRLGTPWTGPGAQGYKETSTSWDEWRSSVLAFAGTYFTMANWLQLLLELGQQLTT